MLVATLHALTMATATGMLTGAPVLHSPIRHLCSKPVALAPSGVDELPLATQQAVVLAAFAGLGTSAIGCASAYEAARKSIDSVWWERWETWSAATLGVTFILAGRSHFTMPAAFKAIYPPMGTWGFWYLPGSADFHVAWTGVAELLGGSGLLLGCLLTIVGQSRGPSLLAFAARAVLLLVLTVTPANVYMYTHGATMPGVTPDELPVGWHAGRFIAQFVVLSVLLTTAGWGPASERYAAQSEAAMPAPERDSMNAGMNVGRSTKRSRGPSGGPRMGLSEDASIQSHLEVLRRCARAATAERPEPSEATLALARVANAGVHPDAWLPALCDGGWRPVFSAKPEALKAAAAREKAPAAAADEMAMASNEAAGPLVSCGRFLTVDAEQRFTKDGQVENTVRLLFGALRLSFCGPFEMNGRRMGITFEALRVTLFGLLRFTIDIREGRGVRSLIERWLRGMRRSGKKSQELKKRPNEYRWCYADE